MKGCSLFVVMLSGLLLSNCVGQAPPEQSQEPVAAAPTGTDRVLSCLTEQQKMSRKEFKAAYKTVSAQAGGTNTDTLNLVCLSLHDYASLKQLKSGMDSLANYIKAHPDDAASLQGIHVLMQRIEKERVSRSAQSNKKLDEKEGLESDNKELLERAETLEKGAAQDKERIRELQKQIEQLKNIEHIIKKRER